MNEEIGHPAPVSGSAHEGSAAADNERMQLALERLRLDNEEQRVRIQQLQLAWWQRPKAMLTMLVPIIPIAWGVVDFAAEKLAEQKRAVAEAEKKAAMAERKEFETENRRLKLVRQQTELENKQLQFDQQVLIRGRNELNERIRQLAEAEKRLVDAVFNRITSVSEIGGRIVTARTVAEADVAFDEFTAYELLSVGADLAEPLREIQDALKHWQAQGQRPGRELEGAVLKLSLACRNAFSRHEGEQFDAPLRDLTRSLYEEAQSLIEAIGRSPDRKDAQGIIDSFWQLYYGKLVLVESEEVEAVMVRAGNALNAWTQGPPQQELFRRLRDEFLHEYNKLL